MKQRFRSILKTIMRQHTFRRLIMNFSEKLQQTLGKAIKDASNEEIYAALLNTVKEAAADKGRNISEKGRKVYYISAEFLIGKLLSNNLINLGVYDEVRELLAANGKDICEIEEVEPEPSLGNGGLGRLAACFLDSIATLGLEGDGIGLNYHLGLFKQVFENHKQKETPNPWIQNTSWLTDTGIGFDVPFKDFSLHSKLYDIDVTGYENGTNKLHLFDIESVNENIVGDGIAFDKNDIRENLTLFLYPDDSDKQGELLRIEKYDENKVYAALYYDGENFYIKRFSFPPSDNSPASFIADNRGAYLADFSSDKHPQFMVTFTGRQEHREPEKFDAEEFIAKKGITAKGNRCHRYDILKVEFIEPLHKPEDDEEECAKPGEIISLGPEDIPDDESFSPESMYQPTGEGEETHGDLGEADPDSEDADEPNLFDL